MKPYLLALTLGILIGVAVNPLLGRSKPPRWWKRDALCIKHRESDGSGGWHADTGNGYFGGMQMDLGFARSYGGWIVAHHGLPHTWRPATQLLVAYRGWLDRGWEPWPTTARACGLL